MTDGLALDMSPAVVQRLRAEVGQDRSEKVIDCLRTALAFLQQIDSDSRGLRLSASAAYNLREALNHVVEGHDPADGGLKAVLTAWRVYETHTAIPGTDHDAALLALESVLSSVASSESRATSYSLKLVTQLRHRAGIDPRGGMADPIAEYQALREIANNGVHEELPFDEVRLLFDRTISWFGRVFAPPDEIVDAILAMAALPWVSDVQTERLADLATNDHLVRLFLGALQDSAWLIPLHTAHVVEVPRPDSAWPVFALAAGLGQTDPARVAEFLDLILRDIASMLARNKPRRDSMSYELLCIWVRRDMAS
ncbi:hypothetical protein J2W56_006605 [Nocardia kruczakiae]|uniref:Uncharacterized protein n=1 Tax=Nocardia kruczakiae TaxID=261477 RepID=A0ABU1XQM9_9NOCA|nr:hypothetical protein [Nocardia kruczakiae]MDR7172839.1 hypothetical protein [Nocardia kruczakiae]